MSASIKTSLDCILFDLDGLLVDSEPLQYRAYRHAFAQFGIELDMNDWIQWHSAEASTRRWVEQRRYGIDVEALRDTKKLYYEDLIADELQPKPGAAALVADCAAQFELAVVSASRRESIEACLARFGLRDYFSCLVSGSESARSKPYPDPYLAALHSLQATALQAIALEDSVTGLRAANAAGIPCVICPDHFIPKAANAFADATLVTPSLQRLSADALRRIHTDTLSEDPDDVSRD